MRQLPRPLLRLLHQHLLVPRMGLADVVEPPFAHDEEAVLATPPNPPHNLKTAGGHRGDAAGDQELGGVRQGVEEVRGRCGC